MLDGLTAVRGDDDKRAEIPCIWEITSNMSNCQTRETLPGDSLTHKNNQEKT